MTLEEDVKKLVEWHERIRKEDTDKNAKLDANNRVAFLVFSGVFLVLAFVIGLVLGYQWGYNQGYSYVMDHAVQIVGPWIRVLI